MPVIDNLVVLGRACPEPMKDGRVTVCLGGWADDQGFVRLYPTRPNFPIHRWDVISAEVEKPPNDNRLESYKIVGSKQDWDDLSQHVEVKSNLSDPAKRRNLIHALADEGLHTINDAKRSLGILKPDTSAPFLPTTRAIRTSIS